MIATVFTIIVVLLGAAYSPAIVLGIPIAVLTGMSFAAPIAAFSATQRTPAKFNVIFRFVITPLFLFSGMFFPIDTLPSFLQAVAWLSPLWHGVVLTRAWCSASPDEAPVLALVHLSILVALVVGRAVAGGPARSSAGWCADDACRRSRSGSRRRCCSAAAGRCA